MTQKEITRIAANYYIYLTGNRPQDLTLIHKSKGQYTFQASHEDDLIHIVVQPSTGEVAQKVVHGWSYIDTHTTTPCKLSELKPGDLFLKHGDNQVWKFRGVKTMVGSTEFGISLNRREEIEWVSKDYMVIPY
jgi:hypothetical protein